MALLEPRGAVNFISGLHEKISQTFLCILSKDNKTQKQGLCFSAILPRSFLIAQGRRCLDCEGVPKRHWIDYKLKEWSAKKEKFYKSWQKKMTITTLTTIKQPLYSFANSVSRLLIRFLLCTHRVTALWSITWEPGRCLRGKICGDVDERTSATTARYTCKHGHWGWMILLNHFYCTSLWSFFVLFCFVLFESNHHII